MPHGNMPVTEKQAPPIAACIHALHKIEPGQGETARNRLSTRFDHAAGADGFILANAIRLTLPDGDYLASHVAFASAPHRDAWVATAAQENALREASAEGAITWVDFTDVGHAAQKPQAPPKWKMAILSWLTIFPTLTTFLMLTSPYLQDLHLVGRIFINTVLIAPLMTWVLMPAMARIFRRWLFGRATQG